MLLSLIPSLPFVEPPDVDLMLPARLHCTAHVAPDPYCKYADLVFLNLNAAARFVLELPLLRCVCFTTPDQQGFEASLNSNLHVSLSQAVTNQ